MIEHLQWIHLQNIVTRAAEHVGISKLSAKRLEDTKDSTVSDHLLQCKCTVNFDHFDILAADISKFNILVNQKRDALVLN